jgi:hypothetical protein
MEINYQFVLQKYTFYQIKPDSLNPGADPVSINLGCIG